VGSLKEGSPEGNLGLTVVDIPKEDTILEAIKGILEPIKDILKAAGIPMGDSPTILRAAGIPKDSDSPADPKEEGIPANPKAEDNLVGLVVKVGNLMVGNPAEDILPGQAYASQACLGSALEKF
jgi:hypothetical protein